MKKTRKVILDTNSLLIPGKYRKDIFEDLKLKGYSVIVPSFIVSELKKLSRKKTGKTKDRAKLGLSLIPKTKIVQARKTAKTTDTALINYALKEKAAVYTNDKKLKKRLKARGIKVLFFRASKKSAKP